MDEPDNFGKALDLGNNVVDLIKGTGGYFGKYADGIFTEISCITVDKLKDYRLRCAIPRKAKLLDTITEELDKRGIDQTRSVYLKLIEPMLEQAFLEEDEELQKIWDRLITNTLDPTFDVEIRYAYIDILKSLTSLDVKILKYVFDFVSENSAYNQKVDLNDCPVSLEKIKDELSTIPFSDIMVSIYNLKRVQCIQEFLYKSKAVSNFSYSLGSDQYYVLTYLGSALVEACMK
jgi:hypothetical protein